MKKLTISILSLFILSTAAMETASPQTLPPPTALALTEPSGVQLSSGDY